MSQAETNIPFITLTTDWGNSDFYCGMLKGKLLTACPNLRIVDISHDVPAFNIHSAAFVARHSYKHFPLGSVHLLLVNSEAGASSRLLITFNQGHYFVVPDNGILGLLFNSAPEFVHQIDFDDEGSFASIESFVKVVENLCNGVPLISFAKIAEDFEPLTTFRATIDDSIISGSIIYIDSYFNAITNISKNLFERVGKNRNYNIFVQSNHNKISKIATSYKQVEPGELMGIFNSADLLEIAIKDGYASQLLSLRMGGSVRVNFL